MFISLTGLMALSFYPNIKPLLFSFGPQSQNASPKQRKQSVYTPPAMKGTVQVLFRVVLSIELMAGKLSVLKDHMLNNKLALVSAPQLNNMTFSKILYLKL